MSVTLCILPQLHLYLQNLNNVIEGHVSAVESGSPNMLMYKTRHAFCSTIVEVTITTPIGVLSRNLSISTGRKRSEYVPTQDDRGQIAQFIRYSFLISHNFIVNSNILVK